MSERVPRLQRASTWWMAGICLHALWMSALGVLKLLVDTRVDRFFDSPESRAENVALYRHVFDAVVVVFVLAILSWLVAVFLSLKQYLIELRRRRGLCEKCAYPIGISPVCTECGAAVRASVVSRTD